MIWNISAANCLIVHVHRLRRADRNGLRRSSFSSLCPPHASPSAYVPNYFPPRFFLVSLFEPLDRSPIVGASPVAGHSAAANRWPALLEPRSHAFPVQSLIEMYCITLLFFPQHVFKHPKSAFCARLVLCAFVSLILATSMRDSFSVMCTAS